MLSLAGIGYMAERVRDASGKSMEYVSFFFPTKKTERTLLRPGKEPIYFDLKAQIHLLAKSEQDLYFFSSNFVCLILCWLILRRHVRRLQVRLSLLLV